MKEDIIISVTGEPLKVKRLLELLTTIKISRLKTGDIFKDNVKIGYLAEIDLIGKDTFYYFEAL